MERKTLIYVKKNSETWRERSLGMEKKTRRHGEKDTERIT